MPSSPLSAAPGERPAGIPEPGPSGNRDADPGSPPPFPPYGFRQIRHDAKFLITRPSRWDRRDWIRVSATAGTAALLFLLREDIREVVQKNRGADRSEFLQDVRTMGKGAFAPSLALIAYLSSFATGKDREKETALLLLESMGFSALATGAGQFLLASDRPEEGNSVQAFRLGGHGISLDTALAASVVPPLRRQYLRPKPGDGFSQRFWKRAATFLLYAGASLTAYQRMDQDKHWAPDVFLGMVTGLAVGNTLCAAHEEANRPLGNLEADPSGGIRWRIRFGPRSRRGPPPRRLLPSPPAPVDPSGEQGVHWNPATPFPSSRTRKGGTFPEEGSDP